MQTEGGSASGSAGGCQAGGGSGGSASTGGGGWVLPLLVWLLLRRRDLRRGRGDGLLPVLLLLVLSTGPALATDYSVGLGPIQLGVGDFTEDGVDDLVTANATASSFTVLLNNGLGGCSSSSTLLGVTNPVCVATGRLRKNVD